jgi:hypothetical protein
VSDPLAPGLLHLLKAEPTLLPVAPESDWAAAIERRRLDEVHACLRCGQRAHCALVAETEIGPRWLDLCHRCIHWLRVNASDTS